MLATAGSSTDFTLQTSVKGGKTYQLRAPSAPVRTEWIEALTKVIEASGTKMDQMGDNGLAEEEEAGAKEESEADLIARAAKIVAGEDELAAEFLVRFNDPVFAALSKVEMVKAVRDIKVMGGKNGKQWPSGLAIAYVLSNKDKMEEVVKDLRKKKK